jgi:threonine dehydratase
MPPTDAELTAERLAGDGPLRARAAVAELVRRTPVLSSQSISERCAGEVVLKAENLQRTGSFKLRGALNKLAALGQPRGVVAASAGNHGQSLAYAARAQGVPCEVFMPREASVAKVAAVESYGGVVSLCGSSVEECLEAARHRAAETGAAFVHPFDDPDVILGQATLGLELLDDVPALGTVIVPVGGGGLAAGVAGAIKSARPRTRVIGVQVEACAPFPRSLAEHMPVSCEASPTIADGIAVKRPGELTLHLIERYLDDLVVVAEDDVAEAMVLLLERAKLVVEGGGAVGVAALLSGAAAATRDGTTAVVLSGGNVDAGLLALVAQRHEATAGRRLRLYTRIADRPGALAALLTRIAEAGGNIVHADHVREAVRLHVRETGVEIALETRGVEHGEQIVSALVAAGYAIERLGEPAGR